MNEYKVIIPEDSFSIVKFNQDDLPGVAVVNSALRNFEPKIVFSWHLSLIIDFEDSDEDGMPSKKEQEILDSFEEYLNSLMKGTDSERQNALFLARITWNNTRELVWRVFEPALTNNVLQDISSKDDFPRPFDYKMENDPKWARTKWHLGE